MYTGMSTTLPNVRLPPPPPTTTSTHIRTQTFPPSPPQSPHPLPPPLPSRVAHCRSLRRSSDPFHLHLVGLVPGTPFTEALRSLHGLDDGSWVCSVSDRRVDTYLTRPKEQIVYLTAEGAETLTSLQRCVDRRGIS